MMGPRFARSVVCLASFVAAASIGPAQTVFTEDAVLIGADTIGGDTFGQAAAIDQDVALIGSSRTGAPKESAYFFRRVAGTWVEEQKVTSPLIGACVYGMAVALDDGRAIVGDPARDFSGFCSGEGALHPFFFILNVELGQIAGAGDHALRRARYRFRRPFQLDLRPADPLGATRLPGDRWHPRSLSDAYVSSLDVSPTDRDHRFGWLVHEHKCRESESSRSGKSQGPTLTPGV